MQQWTISSSFSTSVCGSELSPYCSSMMALESSIRPFSQGLRVRDQLKHTHPLDVLIEHPPSFRLLTGDHNLHPRVRTKPSLIEAFPGALRIWVRVRSGLDDDCQFDTLSTSSATGNAFFVVKSSAFSLYRCPQPCRMKTPSCLFSCVSRSHGSEARRAPICELKVALRRL